ncbi:hypothetical protein HY339_01610 [Candidatus Gottesmanbacteria bacterium]|nr:hypothetical protein [Candidatus Gottesmanbacteria bacterium]
MFYDPAHTYEENYHEGPWGDFGAFERGDGKSYGVFFGHTLTSPIGIGAGILPTSRHIEAAVIAGFDPVTYKTVRRRERPSNPFPNMVRLYPKGTDIHPDDTVVGNVDMRGFDVTKDGATNSFGVPSKTPDVWQPDLARAVAIAKGKATLIASFMGTMRDGMSREAYIADFVETARLVKQTAVPVMEVNLSCPNVSGIHGLVCHDIETSAAILAALHEAKGDTPLLVKIAYFPPEGPLEPLLESIHQYADGVVAVNAIHAKVVDKEGKQLLPGDSSRLYSGTCGRMVRWAGLEMAERMLSYKKKKEWRDFVVVGVGGVTTPEDYRLYKTIGVDVVESVTGANWRPELAYEISAKT